jgi:hypothetical protein
MVSFATGREDLCIAADRSAKAGVFAPALIEKLDAPVGEGRSTNPGSASTTRLSSFSIPVLSGESP